MGKNLIKTVALHTGFFNYLETFGLRSLLLLNALRV
jgi:hypothetical protein